MSSAADAKRQTAPEAVLDATDEDLAAGIVQRAKLDDEGALGRQRHVGYRAGTSQRMAILPHDGGD